MFKIRNMVGRSNWSKGARKLERWLREYLTGNIQVQEHLMRKVC